MIKVFYIYDRIEERADIKGQSELENRRTYKIMDKRNRAKRQTTIYKTPHRKREIEQHEPH
jgi:hypothetical protein